MAKSEQVPADEAAKVDAPTATPEDAQEAALQASLDEINAGRDAAREKARAATAALDAYRTRKRLAAKLGGLTDAERDLLRKDGVASPEPLDARAGANPAQ